MANGLEAKLRDRLTQKQQHLQACVPMAGKKALSLTWQKTRAYKGSVINWEKENNKKFPSNLRGSKLVDEGGPSVTLTASCPVLVRHPGVVVPGLDPFAPLNARLHVRLQIRINDDCDMLLVWHIASWQSSRIFQCKMPTPS